MYRKHDREMNRIAGIFRDEMFALELHELFGMMVLLLSS